MTPFLQLATTLLTILLAAKAAGYLATRLGQPAVLGELVAGVALGPSLVNLTQLSFLTNPHLEAIIAETGELGVLLLMFLAGLELHFHELAKNSKVAALSGGLGVGVTIALGWSLGRLTGLDQRSAIFMGLALGATSVSIAAQTLMELNALRSRVGLALLGAAVFDDILVILLLSAFLAFLGGGGSLLAIVGSILRLAVFLGLSAVFGLWILPRLVYWIAPLRISQGILTLALLVMLLYGIAAEVLGSMAAISGAFLAGMMFARTPVKARLVSGLNALAYSFFIPIFFVSIGLRVDLHLLRSGDFWLVAGMVVVAILGKLGGVSLGARLAGFPGRDALLLGVGMISRGEVQLIVAALGDRQGYMSAPVYSGVVATVIITALVTPPLLRAVSHRSGFSPPAENTVPDPTLSRPTVENP